MRGTDHVRQHHIVVVIDRKMASGRVCHFKLVLLGDTAVGKSCLVVRFVRDEFFEYQEPTIGGEMAMPHDRGESVSVESKPLCSL